MQVLFTCVPGHGHLNPMIPLAREFDDRGCDVRFVTGPELVTRVRELGFACLPAGPSLLEMQANALADPDVQRVTETEPWVVAAAIFGGRARPVVEDLAGAELQPDLVVHDAMEMAGPLVAARCGRPWVTHGLGPRWPSVVEDAMPRFVDPVWREFALEPPARGGLGHHAYLEICPPAVRSDNRRTDHRSIECRSVPLDEPEAPIRLFGDTGRPNLYCTLGTFSNTNASVFRTVLDAVGSLDVDVLLTTGWGVHRDDLGALPGNVTVEAYVPQSQVLRQADLVVCHGGSGTMLAALGAGLPVVALPQGADQFVNAPWWSRSGAVAVMQPAEADAPSIASCISATLRDRSMRRAARATAADIAAMQPPSQVAELLLVMAQS